MGEFFKVWRREWGSPLSMIICVVFIIAVMFALRAPQISSHTASRPAVAKMFLNMADEALKSGDAPQARVVFKKIVEDYGDTPAAHEANDRLQRLGEP